MVTKRKSNIQKKIIKKPTPKPKNHTTTSSKKPEFETEFESWENQKQECIHGDYALTICENVELAEDTEYVSIPIDYDSQDGGYLHVYGMRVKE